MEINEEHKIKENGSHEKKMTKKITKEDGFIDVNEIFEENSKNRKYSKRFFKGFAFLKSYETDDPKITRPVTASISIVGILIGIILLVISLIFKLIFLSFIAIMLLITIICFFINTKKDIDKIEKELNESQKNDSNQNNTLK